VAIAATIGLVIGRYGLDEPQTAVYATLTPVALLGLGQVGGPRAERMRTYAAATLASAAVTTLGTLSSDDTLAASLTLFAGGLVASQAGIAGGNAVGLSRSVLLLLVVSAGIPAPDSAISERLIGIAIGGAMALAATAVLWPDRSDVDFRRRLGAALAPLAKWAGGLGSGAPIASTERSRKQAAAAMEDTRPFLVGLVERPLGVRPIAVAERLLAPGLEQVDELLARIADDALRPADRELLCEAGGALDRAAAVLQDPNTRPPDIRRIEEARRDYRAASEARLAGLLSSGAAAEELARSFDEAFRIRRLAAVSAAVAGQARVAAGVDAGAEIPGTGGGPPRSVANRLKGQARVRLTLGSVVLRNGLRLALALAAARAVAGAFDLEHGFWVVFATLTVVRASARGTGANAARALLGTAIGAVLATALLLAFEAEADIYTVLVPLFAFLAFYGSAVSLVAGQIGFTLLIVAIFNLIAPPQWNIGLIRLEDVAIGAAVGLAIGVAAWPRGPAAQMRDAFADAIDAGAAYTRDVALGLLDSGAGAVTAPARLEAVAAARRAEDVFTFYLSEVADPGAAVTRWTDLLERTHGVWYEAGVIAEVRHHGSSACPALASTLGDAVERVVDGFHTAAEALRSQEPAGPAPAPRSPGKLGRHSLTCAASVAGIDDRARLLATVHIFGVRAWVIELLHQLDGLRARVHALNNP